MKKSVLIFFIITALEIALFLSFGLLIGMTNFILVISIILFFICKLIFSSILIDHYLEAIGAIKWISFESLPDQIGIDLQRIFLDVGLQIPKLGLIEDGAPACFSYGLSQKESRLVLSKGLVCDFKIKEQRALVYRECFNIKFKTHLIMTYLQFIPILILTIYEYIDSALKLSDNSKDKLQTSLYIDFLAGVVYFISELGVRFYARSREIQADQFAQSKLNSNKELVSAILKFGLGIDKKSNLPKQLVRLHAFNPIGKITDDRVLTEDCEINADVLCWEKENPWAKIIEFFSAHNRLSKRIDRILSNPKIKNDVKVISSANSKIENKNYFFNDIIFILFAKIFFVIFISTWIVVSNPQNHVDALTEGAFALFFASLIVGLFVYKKVYPRAPDVIQMSTVEELLRRVDVSYLSPIFVNIKGQVIGRSESGNVFDPNMLVKDYTGNIRVRRTEVFNSLILGSGYEQFKNQDVEIVGLFRRFPNPVIDIQKINQNTYNNTLATQLRFSVYFILVFVLYYILVWLPLHGSKESLTSTRQQAPVRWDDPGLYR